MGSAEPAQAPVSPRHQPLVLAVVLSLALTVLVCFVSNNVNPRFQHRNDTIQQQFAILTGGPLLFDGREIALREWRSRVLFPLSLAAVSRVMPAVSVGQWYLLLRAFTAFAAFACFWFAVRNTARPDMRLAALGLFLLAYEMIFTFNQGWDNPTDFPEVAFAALFVWAIVGRRRWWLVGLVLLATLNREVSVFAGLVWLFAYGFERRVRVKEVAFALGLSAVAVVEALAVRTVMSPPPSGAAASVGAAGALGTQADPGYAGQLTHAMGFWNRVASDLSDFLSHPTPTGWPLMWLAMLTPAIAWIWLNRACMRSLHRRLLLAAACLFPITLAYGTPSELREYLTPLVMLAYLAVVLEGERGQPAEARRELVYEPARDAVSV